jgi:hypothetical protein
MVDAVGSTGGTAIDVGVVELEDFQIALPNSFIMSFHRFFTFQPIGFISPIRVHACSGTQLAGPQYAKRVCAPR